MDTLQTIQNMMAAQFGLKKENLTVDTPLDTLGLDSLSMIEFMFSLEDKFQIKIPSERVEIKTLRDIAALVDRLAAEQRAAG